LEPELPNVIIFITLLSFFIILPSLLSQITNGLYFGHDETVSRLVRNSSLDSQLTSTQEKANVYVVWDDNNGIYFTSSQDGGIKFNTKIILSNSNNFSSAPQIAATQKGDVYVVWVDIDNKTGDSNIEFISSNDRGKTFSAQKELSGGKAISFFPQLTATEEGDVYVVWVDIDNKTGDSNIEFISSNDRGKTFSAQKELRGGDTMSFSPQIAATEKGNVYVVWVDKSSKTRDSNIEFISSNDSGKTFSAQKELRGGDTISFSPQIAATEKGDVYVVWVDKSSKTGDSDITFRSSNDSGMSFEDRNRLRRSDSLLSFTPQLTATEKGDVYVVWVDKNSTTGDSDITFRSSNDRGRDFERVINLNKGEKKGSNSSLPQLATTGNNSVYVVWADNQIQFKEIIVKDAIVGNTISLSNKTAFSLSPQIVGTKNGDLFVVWIDKNNMMDRSLHFKRISQNYFDGNS
jgi:hypothetical protein